MFVFLYLALFAQNQFLHICRLLGNAIPIGGARGKTTHSHLALCYAQYTIICLHEARKVFLAMCLFVFVLCVHWYFFIERFCDFFESNRSLAHSAINLTKHTRFKSSENRYSAFRDWAELYVCVVVMFFLLLIYKLDLILVVALWGVAFKP